MTHFNCSAVYDVERHHIVFCGATQKHNLIESPHKYIKRWSWLGNIFMFSTKDSHNKNHSHWETSQTIAINGSNEK